MRVLKGIDNGFSGLDELNFIIENTKSALRSKHPEFDEVQKLLKKLEETYRDMPEALELLRYSLKSFIGYEFTDKLYKTEYKIRVIDLLASQDTKELFKEAFKRIDSLFANGNGSEKIKAQFVNAIESIAKAISKAEYSGKLSPDSTDIKNIYKNFIEDTKELLRYINEANVSNDLKIEFLKAINLTIYETSDYYYKDIYKTDIYKIFKLEKGGSIRKDKVEAELNKYKSISERFDLELDDFLVKEIYSYISAIRIKSDDQRYDKLADGILDWYSKDLSSKWEAARLTKYALELFYLTIRNSNFKDLEPIERIIEPLKNKDLAEGLAYNRNISDIINNVAKIYKIFGDLYPEVIKYMVKKGNTKDLITIEAISDEKYASEVIEKLGLDKNNIGYRAIGKLIEIAFYADLCKYLGIDIEKVDNKDLNGFLDSIKRLVAEKLIKEIIEERNNKIRNEANLKGTESPQYNEYIERYADKVIRLLDIFGSTIKSYTKLVKEVIAKTISNNETSYESFTVKVKGLFRMKDRHQFIYNIIKEELNDYAYKLGVNTDIDKLNTTEELKKLAQSLISRVNNIIRKNKQINDIEKKKYKEIEGKLNEIINKLSNGVDSKELTVEITRDPIRMFEAVNSVSSCISPGGVNFWRSSRAFIKDALNSEEPSFLMLVVSDGNRIIARAPLAIGYVLEKDGDGRYLLKNNRKAVALISNVYTSIPDTEVDEEVLKKILEEYAHKNNLDIVIPKEERILFAVTHREPDIYGDHIVGHNWFNISYIKGIGGIRIYDNEYWSVVELEKKPPML
ncbi:MAG: hypothetical protein ARM1_0615 [Candidatus Micrarchaeota archaeon]|nr:MAG: hypothetical protein ARM1_0615 [Candidatus Micrarchaeota archaeon]